MITDLEKINDFFYLDHKHLRSLLLSKDFEGAEESRNGLLDKLNELDMEFSNVPSTISKEEVKVEWARRYSILKLQVYKNYGYTKA